MGCNVQTEIQTVLKASGPEARSLGWHGVEFAPRPDNATRNRRLDESAADNQNTTSEREAA